MKYLFLSAALLVLLFPAGVVGGVDPGPVSLKGLVDGFVSGDRSKTDVEGFLYARGYSPGEVEGLISNLSTRIVVKAFERNMSREYISQGFRDRGFTPDEINMILGSVAIELTREALSEGTSLEEIRLDLWGKGFTASEINGIIRGAGSQPQGDGRGVSSVLGVILVLIFVLILILVVVFFFIRGRRKSGKEVPSQGVDVELQRLQSEKSSIEEMICIAKTKYHKRKLDEVSFREIVRDHQRRLIEIEARINRIELRVQRLEGGDGGSRLV